MFVVSLKKLIKSMLLFMGIAVIISVMVGIIGNYREPMPAKADRSNAMQVTKPIIQDPVLPVASPDFFIEYRLERDKLRSERSDLLRDIIKNAKNDDQRQRAHHDMLGLLLEKQRETEMENLIKAKGFADALVLIRNNSVNAVIKASSLSREEAVQVADVISRTAGVKLEDITISAKP